MDRAFHFSALCPIDFADVLHVLGDEPAVLVGLHRETALHLSADHEPVHVHVDVPMPHHPHHDVDVDLGCVRAVDRNAAMIPVTWHDGHHGPWFPDVDAELEVLAVSHRDPSCELAFFGTYHPHLGVLGAGWDRLGGYRTVHAELERFFERAREALYRTLLEERLQAVA